MTKPKGWLEEPVIIRGFCIKLRKILKDKGYTREFFLYAPPEKAAEYVYYGCIFREQRWEATTRFGTPEFYVLIVLPREKDSYSVGVYYKGDSQFVRTALDIPVGETLVLEREIQITPLTFEAALNAVADVIMSDAVQAVFNKYNELVYGNV